jgi:hypothetical protein
MALRLIAAVASVITGYISFVFIKELLNNEKNPLLPVLASGLLVVFSPALIQFAHFGTTESLLMLFFTIIVYKSVLLVKEKISLRSYFIWCGCMCGLALGTKISSAIFVLIPCAVIIFHILRSKEEQKITRVFYTLVRFGVYIAILAVLTSPHNYISFGDFLNSMRYESGVGIGKMLVFYTRQYFMTIPIEFQLREIFPYALGWPVFILSLLGLFFLPYKKEYNLLRIAFLIGFLPNAFVYTKWTRFVSLVFPLMVIVGTVFLCDAYEKSLQAISYYKKNKKYAVYSLQGIFMYILLIAILPGVAFLSIYKTPDVRFQASEWIYKNIPEGSTLLSETANVVDLPIPTQRQIKTGQMPHKQYSIISFNYYNLDQDPVLQQELDQDVHTADYIVIPSRRIFANHTCYMNSTSSPLIKNARCASLKYNYPVLNEYYRKLFSGELGYKLVKEFTSYPSITLFGKTIYQLPDEMAEETWSVFDHPVVRIYKNEKKTTIK